MQLNELSLKQLNRVERRLIERVGANNPLYVEWSSVRINQPAAFDKLMEIKQTKLDKRRILFPMFS